MISKDIIEKERRWFEKCQLITLYHEQKVIQYGSRRSTGWTIADTAKDLRLSNGTISESLTVIKLEEKLHLRTCRTREEAMRLVRIHRGEN